MQEDRIVASVLAMAEERGTEKTFCPSEIARELFPDDWRTHMNDVVAVAISLQKQGKVLITQKGEPVDIDHIKGPIRIKRI